MTLKSQSIAVNATLIFVIKVALCQGSNSGSGEFRQICGEDCNSWMRCNPYEDEQLLYGLDSWDCRIFKTRCFFDFENCKRAYHCKKPLLQIDRKSCMLLYFKCDDPTDDPVCAWFITAMDGANEFKTFKNECILNHYVWKNEKPYINFEYGKCQQEKGTNENEIAVIPKKVTKVKNHVSRKIRKNNYKLR